MASPQTIASSLERTCNRKAYRQGYRRLPGRGALNAAPGCVTWPEVDPRTPGTLTGDMSVACITVAQHFHLPGNNSAAYISRWHASQRNVRRAAENTPEAKLRSVRGDLVVKLDDRIRRATLAKLHSVAMIL
jgi:hypothetical protein